MNLLTLSLFIIFFLLVVDERSCDAHSDSMDVIPFSIRCLHNFTYVAATNYFYSCGAQIVENEKLK